MLKIARMWDVGVMASILITSLLFLEITCYEKFTARLDSLKMVSVATETHPSGNSYVIGYTQCGE
jgi:hypothetical protein